MKSALPLFLGQNRRVPPPPLILPLIAVSLVLILNGLLHHYVWHFDLAGLGPLCVGLLVAHLAEVAAEAGAGDFQSEVAWKGKERTIVDLWTI